jgi:hypothetical protein
MNRTVVREPGRGSKYSGLLIVGEAHHGLSPIDDNAEATIRLIEETIAGWKYAFFTKIAQVVTGATASEIDRAEFWPTVAFHNFVQSSIGAARIRPTRQQWEQGHEIFPTILEKLKPTHVLVLAVAS